MFRHAVLATGVALALTLPAAAQDQPPPPPPHGEAMAPDSGGPPPPKGPPGAPRAGQPRSGPPMMPPPPPPPPMKGFSLDYGKGVGLKVTCGDEPMKACIEAARPLIDKLPVFDAGSLARP